MSKYCLYGSIPSGCEYYVGYMQLSGKREIRRMITRLLVRLRVQEEISASEWLRKNIFGSRISKDMFVNAQQFQWSISL